MVSKRERRRDARALRKAVRRGELETIREKSASCPGALQQKSLFRRRTLLMAAVKGRRTSGSTRMTNTLVVSTLLWAAEESLGSSDAYSEFLNAKDVFGNTALHIACKSRSLSSVTVVRMLLEEGASPLIFNRRGNTCLHVAAAFCNTGCLEVILDSHVGGTRASQVTVGDRIGDVPFVDAMNNSGLTALHIAALTTQHTSVGVLVERGAQLDIGVARGLDNLPYLCGGSTALHMSASLGDVRSVMILLQSQWSVPGMELRRIRNIVGLTPLNCALLMGYHSVVRILIDTPRRDPAVGGLALNQRQLNASRLSQSQNTEFTSSLRDHMRRVLHKATLLVTLRDISLYWKTQEGTGTHRSTCAALDSISLSSLSLDKITEMYRLLENQDASLRDILFGFERVLYSCRGSDGAVQRQVRISNEAQREDECAICFANPNEVALETCGHQACFECTAMICIKQTAGDVTCPFCRQEIASVAALEPDS